MTYSLLKFAHILGAILIGAGLIGVWMSDLRSRQLRELHAFSEAVRNIAVFYDGVVVPGAILLLASGGWLIWVFYGGWGFLDVPWLLGMVVLFAFEFIEGNTVTRVYFMRLRRITREALRTGGHNAGTGGGPRRGAADLHPFPRPADPVRHRRPGGLASDGLDPVPGGHRPGHPVGPCPDPLDSPAIPLG